MAARRVIEGVRDMDRRNFLKSVTGVATAVAAGSATAEAAAGQNADRALPHVGSAKQRLRVALAASDNSQGLSDFCQQFATRVRELTEGDIQFEIVSQIRSGLKAITSGAAECCCATEHANQGTVPELAFFAGLPGDTAMTAASFQNWLGIGGGQDLWDTISADLGVKSLAIAHTGPSSGLWSRASIKELGALEGRPVFAEGLAADVVTGIGAEAFAGTSQDVANGLENDTVFAAEVGDIPTALGTGLVQAARVVTTPGINRVGSVVSFGIKKSIWDGFNASQRAVIEAAATTTYQDTLGFTQAQARMMREACTRQFGLRFEDMSPNVMKTVARVSDIVIAHLAASSPRAARINASYMTFLKANGLVS